MDDEEWDAIMKEAAAEDSKNNTQKKKRRREPGEAPPPPPAVIAEALERTSRDKVVALPPSNVGNQLLLKMGFQGTIGKTNAATTPVIPIIVRKPRVGLGKDEEEERAAKAQLEQIRSTDALSEQQFASLMRKQKMERRQAGQFRAALRLVDGFEDDASDLSPWKSLYQEWVSTPDTEEAWLEHVSENLSRCVAYLRDHHLYCFWCGHRFESLEDMTEHCPGTAEDDH